MSAARRSQRSPPSLSPAPTRPLPARSLVPVLGSGRSRGGCGLGRAGLGWVVQGWAGLGGGRPVPTWFALFTRRCPGRGGRHRQNRSPPFLSTARVLSAAQILISAANMCNRFFLFFFFCPPFLHLIPT